MTDAELASMIAERAGALLVDLRANYAGNALGADGDRLANEAILEMLGAARPADAILSEERACDGARLAHHRVWIVDPLDGTREFGEGRDDWAVHIGLAIDGVAAVGAVALPALRRVYNSGSPSPLNAANAPLRMVVSRSRPAPVCIQVAQALAAELVPMGSAGAKAMSVVSGEADIYLHAGGQYEWDNCAPAAVALAYGLHCSRIDGSPLRYNRVDPYLPDILICRRELAPTVLRILAS